MSPTSVTFTPQNWNVNRLITVTGVDDDLADSLGLPKNRGELVQTVQPGEAAEKAGIRPGDIVTSVNNSCSATIGIYISATSFARTSTITRFRIIRADSR